MEAAIAATAATITTGGGWQVNSDIMYIHYNIIIHR